MIQAGQVVVCINAKKLNQVPGVVPPLKEGNKYLINGVKKCKCGMVLVDVGISTDSKFNTCSTCLTTSSSDGIHWCCSSRFAQISVDQEHVKAIERLKEQEVFGN